MPYEYPYQAKIYKEVPQEFDELNGYEFEIYISRLIKEYGCEINVTKKAKDFGVNILVVDLDGKKIAVQAKRYSNPVGKCAVQEVFAGKAYYDCKSAYVITSNYFTKEAIKLAEKLDCYLLNRDFLVRMKNHEF